MRDPVIGLTDRELESIELLDCPLHLPQINEILHFIKLQIKEQKIAPYHVERRQGELKGLILKANHDASEILVRFILRSDEMISKVRRTARAIQKKFQFVKVVSANIQPLAAAVLEGPQEIILTEERVIWEKFGTVQLAFAPQSFSQVTHEVARALYQHVDNLVQGKKIRSWIDLFCGVGGFSMVAGRHLEWARGVEISTQAIECASMASKRNQVPHLDFESADVEAFLENYRGSRPDALLFNPPRRGLSQSIIKKAKELKVETIFYSSCNPETLLRDLILLGPEYGVESLKPFDMFPLTEHLEVLGVARVRS